MALLPGALTVFLAFRSGGFFTETPALVAVVLIVALLCLIMLASHPREGLSPPLLVVAGALALFAIWTLASGGWSDAPGRALIEFDRALVYVLALLVFGLLGADPKYLRWMVRGIGIAALTVCAISLTTRLLPDVWPITYQGLGVGLSYPVTYANTLGLLAAVGLIISFGLTASEHEPRSVRVVAAAAMPVFGSVLVLVLSRGAVACAALGLIVFAVVARPRGLLPGIAAGAPATAIAVIVTYHADLLVSDNPVSSAARDQGERVAIVVGLCVAGAALLRGLLLRIDDSLAGLRLDLPAQRRIHRAGLAALTVVLIAAAVAVDLPRQYERLVDTGAPARTEVGDDPRARLTDPRNNDRLTFWGVALDGFKEAPFRGHGARTFELSWQLERPTPVILKDAHSLYLEVMSELGLVGLVLLAAAILGILISLGRRSRGPDRALYGTIFAAAIAWAVAAGIDWHWEMPVVTLWFFALGGAAIARVPTDPPRDPAPALLPRLAVAAACCALLLVPVRLALSQDRLESGLSALQLGRCDRATKAAERSLDAIGGRPEPYEIEATCALIDRQPSSAMRLMSQALRRDPANWRLHYGLAVTQARAGRDPRRSANAALRLNPQEASARDAVKRFEAVASGGRSGDRGSARAWQRTSRLMLNQLPPR